MESLYTTESDECDFNNIYKQALHVYNISYCGTSKVEEYSVDEWTKLGR